MLKFLGPFKKYECSDRGGDSGYLKNMRKCTRGGDLPRVYVSLYLF